MSKAKKIYKSIKIDTKACTIKRFYPVLLMDASRGWRRFVAVVRGLMLAISMVYGLLLTSLFSPAFAQTSPNGVPSDQNLPKDRRSILPLFQRPGDELKAFDEIPLQQQQKTPQFKLPSPPTDTQDNRLSSQLQVDVKSIVLRGNTLFSDEELGTITRSYERRRLTSEDLLNLRQALTLHYINNGYINSGATIPDQEVDDGNIEIQIVEGELSEIQLSGNRWLRDRYIETRLRRGNTRHLNINQLRERMQLLQQDRLIGRINAELSPGRKSGQSILTVDVEESRPYEMGVAFDNRRSPSVGELRGSLWGTLHNLTGIGDRIGVRFGITEGLNDYAAFYSVPLDSFDTRLEFYYNRSDSEVVEEPFTFIGIESESETFGVSLSRPFFQTLQGQLQTTLSFERRESKTFLGGDAFPFAPGVPEEGDEKGVSTISAVRLSLEWVNRSSNQVLALRSQFSAGLDVLGATNNSSTPDSQFFAWLGQFQWVRRLGESNTQVLVRSDLQIAADPLLPLEKFGLGGATSVRGYRQNVIVRDKAWAGSLEFRIPVFRLPIPRLSRSAEDGVVQLAPFFDMGWSDDVSIPGSEDDNGAEAPDFIYSAGIGLRWDPARQIHAELYWGHGFRDLDSGTQDQLQDQGIHFLLSMQLF